MMLCLNPKRGVIPICDATNSSRALQLLAWVVHHDPALPNLMYISLPPARPMAVDINSIPCRADNWLSCMLSRSVRASVHGAERSSCVSRDSDCSGAADLLIQGHNGTALAQLLCPKTVQGRFTRTSLMPDVCPI